MKAILLSCMLAAASASAQDTSGVIEYEVTSRIEFGNMIVSRSVNGVTTTARGADAAAGMDLPDVMTTKQVFTFSGNKGKMEIQGGPGGMAGGPVMMTSSFRMSGATAGVPATPPPSAMKQIAMKPPVSSANYMDLARKKNLTVLNEMKDSTVTATWFSEDDYKTGGTFKSSSKTKTIAGYKCQRATAKLGEETFTIWYTTEIPLLFSPVNGILPEKGVILSIESSRRSFVAKTVQLKPVADTDVSLPANAQKITSEELNEKRRQIMERFQNEQFRKFQQAQ